MPFDGKALGEGIVVKMREFVGRSISALEQRINTFASEVKRVADSRDELEEKLADLRERVTEWQRKADAEFYSRVPEVVANEVARAVAALPVPKDGEPGKDADPAMIGSIVAFQVQREVSDAIAALPKPKDGEPGKDAEPIHPDTIALMVHEAVDKAMVALPKPEHGKAGEPGRDATQLDPLPAIDEAKSYARGTWASHRGGLWKALTQTDGMQGWQIMVDGVAAIGATEAGDPRHFVLALQTASGKTVQLPFSVPAMIYRGIWKEGEYERGDCVTWGGSMFHCDAEKTTDKPETSTAWKLCAKRGRDGKDFDAPKPDSKPVRLK